MAEENGNGNGRGAWLKQVPLWGALVAAVSAALFAGRVSTKVDNVSDRVQVIEASTGFTALDARVRSNTERISAHESQSDARWQDVSRRLERLENRQR